jgi:hypothetical protein
VKNLIISLLLCLSCGCATITGPNSSRFNYLFSRNPPEFEKFIEIYNKPYEIHKYDCSNKCAEYVSYLMSKGIFSQLLVIDHDGPNIDKLIFYESRIFVVRHAIVRVFWRNKFIYCDPTNFIWSNDINDFCPAGLSGITQTVDLQDFIYRPKAYSF